MSENDQVKLKPLFGIHPGKYLVIFYAMIISLIFFLLFFLPGIIRPGTVYHIEVGVENAAVLVDGIYKGAAPCDVFVRAGEHRLTISRKYFTDIEQDIVSGKRIFASLFVPRKENFNIKLVLSEPDALLESSFTEFANWGMIDTYFDNYQPEPVVGPLFKDLYKSGYNDRVKLSAFLYSAMPFVHNELLYSDFLEGLMWFEAVKSGEGLQENILSQDFAEIPFFQDTASFFENLPFWYYSLISDENRGSNTNWYPAMQEEYGVFLRDFSNDYPSATAAVTVNGMRFIMLSGGQFLMGTDGNTFPYPASTDDFFMMDREVSNDLYRIFLNENPQWRTENIAELIEKGDVNQDYLRDFDQSEGNKPINFISWFAADAFCGWIETKLPAYLSGYTVRLPDEIEWEWAALTESNNGGIFKESGFEGPESAKGRYPNNSGLYDLKGNLWEWCGNWYAPASSLITSRDPLYNESYIGEYPGIEKSVRGGSWANERNISTSTRGSQPPSWCTDFLGFRPVIVKE
ncbi:MAG: SUMF1/EgtB/PvdO family nonheme iron enzyme [Spirochaetales bacterium]|nr:SUMF1/EgtB/PvdO family nonheme iron enzyme [Spirochaetales bacterium]